MNPASQVAENRINVAAVVLNLCFLAAGALVTWAVARHYYKRAGDELRGKVQKLSAHVSLVRSLSNVMLHALRDAGMLQFEKDERGVTAYDPDTGLPAIVMTEELTYLFKAPDADQP